MVGVFPHHFQGLHERLDQLFNLCLQTGACFQLPCCGFYTLFTRTTSKDDTRGLATTSGPYPAADVSLFHLYTGKATWCLHQGHFRTTSTSNEVKRLPLGCHHRKKGVWLSRGLRSHRLWGVVKNAGKRGRGPGCARADSHVTCGTGRARPKRPGRPGLDLPAGFVLGSRRLGPRSAFEAARAVPLSAALSISRAADRWTFDSFDVKLTDVLDKFCKFLFKLLLASIGSCFFKLTVSLELGFAAAATACAGLVGHISRQHGYSCRLTTSWTVRVPYWYALCISLKVSVRFTSLVPYDLPGRCQRLILSIRWFGRC